MTFEEYRMNVIRHELGHWLMAGHLKFKRGGIRIKILSNGIVYGHEGCVTVYPMHDLTSSNSIQKYAEDRISILLAGVAAQLLFENVVSAIRCKKLLDEYGADDNGKIEELTNIVRGIVKAGSMSMENEIDHKKEIRTRCWVVAAEYLEKTKPILVHMSSCVADQITRANEEYSFEHDQLCRWFAEASNLEHNDDRADA